MFFANFRRWLNLAAQSSKQIRKPAAARRFRPTIESLEDRFAPAPITFSDPNTTAGDQFGSSVAVSGSYVLVGAEDANGAQSAAYLYNTSGQLLHTLTDPNANAGDNFGNSVALSGNDLLVGADGVNGFEGAAYLYNTSGQLLQTLTDPNASTGPTSDFFGNSVALSGNDLLVGAYGVNGFEGAAYLYNTSGQLIQTIAAPNAAGLDRFGNSVALSGNELLVGADGANNFEGAAYLYNTSGQLLQTLTDPNNPPSSDDLFGTSVALSGSNLVVVGTPQNSNPAGVYLYNTSGQLLQTLTPPPAGDSGPSVALSGNDLLVGAAGANTGGAAYLYNTSGILLQTINGPNGGGFGNSVALSGNNLLVGAQGANDLEGAAYLYNDITEVSALFGNNQSTTVGTAFGTLLEAQVTDGNGNPVEGASVTFGQNLSVLSSAGALGSASVTVTTNADGIAIDPVITANAVAGSFTYTASSGSESATFNLTNLSGAPAELSLVGGTPQAATEGSAFGTLLQALVTDNDGNPVAGAAVIFAVPTSGPTGTFDAFSTVLSNAQGIATAPALTANDDAGPFTATATYTGLPAVDFSLTNTASSAVSGAAPADVAPAGGTPQSTTEGSAFGTLLQALVTDSNGNPVADASVTFTVPTAGATGTFDALATVPTNALGIATAPSLLANHQTGSFVVTATVSGVGTPADFDLTNTLVPATISVQAGSGQKETVGDAYATPLGVKVVNAANQPVSGISVDFETPGGGASGAFAGGGVSTTNANGIATAPTLAADDTVGTFTVEAFVAGVANPAKFTLTNTAGAAAAISVAAGNNQSATVARAYATALQAEVVDQFGNPVSGATVTFAINPQANAGGAFPGAKLQIAETTNSSGIAKAPTLTANVTAGPFTVAASVPGVATPATFNLTNNADPPYLAPKGAPESGGIAQFYTQALQAIVTDKYGNPIAGVAVMFTAPASGPSGTFAGHRSVVAVTNANGVATAPTFTANTKAGRFVVTLTARHAPVGSLILTNLPGPAAAVKVVGTATRTTKPDGILRNLEVQVTDQYGNVIADEPVTFTIQPNALLGATASFSGAASATQTSNTSGLAIAPLLTAAGKRGGFTVIARIAGITSDAVFDLSVEG